MDDETRAYLDAMEARLMGRMNDNQERALERMRGIEMSVSTLSVSVNALTEIARNTNTLLSVLTSSVVDIAGRVTRLESKP